MPDMNTIVGSHDILMITLDTLRYDVAKLEEKHCPNLCGSGSWEKRHTPGVLRMLLTMLFGGFMPTPANTDKASHIRLFHSRNTGLPTHPHTWLFDTPDIVSGFAAEGYRTVCIGGVIFYEEESSRQSIAWIFSAKLLAYEFRVTNPRSTENQVNHALKLLNQTGSDEKLFLFMNISAIHGPNRYFVEGAREDSVETQRAALRYVDKALGPLFEAMRERERPTFCLVFLTMVPPMVRMDITVTDWRTMLFGRYRTVNLFYKEEADE